MTSRPLRLRLRQHIVSLRHSPYCPHKADWLSGLIAEGFTPSLLALEVVSDLSTGERAEVKWIARLRGLGCQLVNATNGGRTNMLNTGPYQPITPGDILREEFMEPQGISVEMLADSSNLSASAIEGILSGTESIKEETARQLSIRFGNSEEFWLNLETNYRRSR